MRKSWTEVTESDGSAAFMTAELAKENPIVPGAVLSAQSMIDSLAERQEQLSNLLKVHNPENQERVAAELRRVIITVHVPKSTQEALADIIQPLNAPVLMRLSNVSAVTNPLAPTMILGLSDGKLMLDALRMLFAEMYSAENLDVDSSTRTASIVIQEQPELTATWRILRTGNHVIVEGTKGLGCWVGVGEPDRFLFEGEEFQHAENGDAEGIAWDNGIVDHERLPLGGEEAQALIAFAKPYMAKTMQPLFFASTAKGFVCLGAGARVPPRM